MSQPQPSETKPSKKKIIILMALGLRYAEEDSGARGCWKIAGKAGECRRSLWSQCCPGRRCIKI